jgi:phosphoglycolate phosphatase-like HAD superfamily hydrolase
MHAALRSVYGVHERELQAAQVNAAGRTDLEIVRAVLLRVGLDARHIDDGLSEVRAICAAEYAQRCPPDLSAFVIAGVPDLLAELSARPALRLSLVTGNIEPVARLKLMRAGLGHYFAPGQGAFGSDAEDRALLPALARRRAGSNGVPFRRERTLLIGDTPRDIACARADGLRCIAVATGPYRAQDLAGADAVVADTRELGYALTSFL